MDWWRPFLGVLRGLPHRARMDGAGLYCTGIVGILVRRQVRDQVAATEPSVPEEEKCLLSPWGHRPLPN